MLAQKPAKLPILRDKKGKMNRFRVTLGRESDFEEVWLSRDSHLKGVPVAGAPNIPLAPPVTSPSAKSSQIMETMISARATTA